MTRRERRSGLERRTVLAVGPGPAPGAERLAELTLGRNAGDQRTLGRIDRRSYSTATDRRFAYTCEPARADNAVNP